jgi:hypothetical protein
VVGRTDHGSCPDKQPIKRTLHQRLRRAGIFRRLFLCQPPFNQELEEQKLGQESGEFKDREAVAEPFPAVKRKSMGAGA